MEFFLGAVVLVIVLVVVFRRRAEAPARHPDEPAASSPSEMDKKHQDAVRYIRNSGDSFAINQLNEIRHRPEAYRYYFWKYADDNPVLKTALGLLAGYLTWELLSDDSREDELAIAMERLDTDLENDTVPWDGEVDQRDDFTFDQEGSTEDEEMDRLYADLDDTDYFDEMMDD